MTATPAERAQQRRRRGEIKQKQERGEVTGRRTKSKRVSEDDQLLIEDTQRITVEDDSPIVIEDDSPINSQEESPMAIEEDSPIFIQEESPISIQESLPIAIEDNSDDEDEISAYQEEEIKISNQANEMFQYMQAGMDDETSDDNPPDSNNEHVESFWPLFTEKALPVSMLPAARQLKSGRVGYRKPVENPNSLSKKLVPYELPSSTKHDQKKCRLKALGANNSMMANYLIREKNPKEASFIDPTLACIPESDHSNSLVESRLATQYKNYHSAPRETNLKKQREEKAQDQWKLLDSALNFIDESFKDKKKKDSSFQYPHVMMSDLREFNYLRREYTVGLVSSPSFSAALATSKSSIRRRKTTGNKQNKSTSGIYLARLISNQAQYVVDHKELLHIARGNHSNHKSMLDNIDIRKALITWSASQTPGTVTPLSFQKYVNEALPGFDIERTISRDTATHWMLKLGFSPSEYKKSLYFDGHERPDVVESRKKYVDDYNSLQKYSRIHVGDNLDVLSEVDPDILGDNRETVFIFHDESTIHSKERPRQAWLLPGTTELRSKNVGQLIHISDFILETTGRLFLSSDQFENLQSCGGEAPESPDAATIIYPGANKDKWWDMEQLCHQVSTKAIPIFETLHPHSQAVFIFDCSSAHGAFAKSALRAQNMNLKPGGKQGRLRDSIIPSDDPRIPTHLRGQVQSFCFEDSHADPQLAGQPKGVQVILQERGLWQYYTAKAKDENKPKLNFRCATCTTSNIAKDAVQRSAKFIQQAEENGYYLTPEQCVEQLSTSLPPKSTPDILNPPSNNIDPSCCWSKIMAMQSDFVSERPLLQAIIKDAGHACLFLPKFHCKLNPIELFWSYIKQAYRKQSHLCKTFPQSKALFKEIRKSCPLISIRRYFRRTDWQLSIYQLGYSGPASPLLMKIYKTHCCISREAASQVDQTTT
ncbi:hypothetical protein PSTG_01427 [Puccinia striiformis f. sp. tritici PST-78]|uniref:Tc1-like transposase DDE domain-containing protein n=1 Tax=Puccinia striiformis f. sp. tritici PST-78 TaxID=1165861 RepID=A0A0L0W251_9BASI|nr:hypothetical protein PSTG_01427 [Puccinia striiformis f. sp. tritici PST-78]